jgi:large subunit ribosomal protein L25
MNYATLKTISREPKGTRENKRLRKDGMVPGTVLKLDKTSIPLSIKRTDLFSLISGHGKAAVFKLGIDRKKQIFAMIRDIDMLPHTNNYLNISLFEVSLKEEIKANVDFRIINEDALLLSKLSVTLYLKSLSVAGLPNDIPDFIEIDGAKLKNGDNILLKDITLPDTITTDVDPESMVFAVSTFKSAPPAPEADETGEAAAENIE